MKYSRFNEQTAMYDVFEDRRTHALNGDLPVPSLGRVVNGIGVPARQAGRRLPSGAKRIGQSWEPVGVVVVTDGGGGLGAIDPGSLSTVQWIGGGAIAGAIVGAIKQNVIGGAVAGGIVGAIGIYLAGKQ